MVERRYGVLSSSTIFTKLPYAPLRDPIIGYRIAVIIVSMYQFRCCGPMPYATAPPVVSSGAVIATNAVGNDVWPVADSGARPYNSRNFIVSIFGSGGSSDSPCNAGI